MNKNFELKHMARRLKNMTEKLFQGNRIQFAENANFLVFMTKKVPVAGSKITDKWFQKEHAKSRFLVGFVALIGRVLVEFFKKSVYALVFLYLPYKILGNVCPNVLNNQEKSILYFFLIMTTLCGTITNRTLFTMSDKDYIMLKVMNADENMYYIERIVYKMLTELVYFTAVLWLLGVGAVMSFAVSVLTVAMRPAGEFVSLVIHDHMPRIYRNRGTIEGLIIVAAVIAAYVLPYVKRTISDAWLKAGHPICISIAIIIGAVAMYFLCNYKKYAQIAQEAIYVRREE